MFPKTVEAFRILNSAGQFDATFIQNQTTHRFQQHLLRLSITIIVWLPPAIKKEGGRRAPAEGDVASLRHCSRLQDLMFQRLVEQMSVFTLAPDFFIHDSFLLLQVAPNPKNLLSEFFN